MDGRQIQKIGRYVIQREIGRGGMAVVYQAYDPRLDRTVAIKLILSEVFGANVLDKMHERFEREAKALGKLDHPNIVRVFDYGEYEGSPYLIMDYIDGVTLHDLKKPIPLADAIRLIAPVAEALDYVHRQGLLHRDVKPSNILITKDSRAILTDFGIVKQMEKAHGETGLTGAGIGIGTPDYMSPEQGLGKGVDERSDMYSLAVVLYELVTGVRPFVGDTPVEIIMNHVKQPLPDPRRVVPSLPEDAVAFFERALAKDAKDRYPIMDDFLRDLYGLRLGSQLRDSTRLHQPKSTPATEISVHRPPAKTSGQPPTSTKGRKSPIGWIAAGMAILVLGLGVFFARERIKGLFPRSVVPQRITASVELTASATVAPADIAAPTVTLPVIREGTSTESAAIVPTADVSTAVPMVEPTAAPTSTLTRTATSTHTVTAAPTLTVTNTATATLNLTETAAAATADSVLAARGTQDALAAAARQAKKQTLAAVTGTASAQTQSAQQIALAQTQQSARQTAFVQTQQSAEQTAFAQTQNAVTPTLSIGSYRATIESIESQNQAQPVRFTNLEVGSLVSFGRFEQDNNLKNGKEAIQWRVLDVDDETALLISEVVLAMRPYHTQVQPVNWDMCSLRSWLNRDFYENAFTSSERKSIALTRLINDDTPTNYYTDDGKVTEDYVFLLRSEDLPRYFPRTPDLKTAASEVVNELRKNEPFGTSYYTTWWLRSLGTDTFKAAVVEIDGTLKLSTSIDSAYVGVRPVIRVYLNP